MTSNIEQSIRERFKGKKILILGFGKEGQSTYHLFRNIGGFDLYIMDQKEEFVCRFMKEQEDSDTKVITENDYLANLGRYDYIFKTPGLPGYLLKHVEKNKITSQSQLFMEYVGDRCVGITGTKGKSTTSSIIAHVLKENGEAVKLVGNIGYPALESLLKDDGQMLYVYEMSSFQTEFLMAGPRIGVILNLFEEHLNNYEGYEAYQQSKLQLFKAAVKEPSKQLLIYGCDNHVLREKIKGLKVDYPTKQYDAFGSLESDRLNDNGYFLKEDVIIRKHNNELTHVSSIDFSRKILGIHNLLNSLVAFSVMEHLANQGLIKGISKESIIKSLSTFRGLKHRLEDVGEFNGVRFYNDSISTIPEATVKAVEAVKKLETLIIGGFDRKIGYKYLAGYLDHLEGVTIICLPETGHKVYDLMEHKEKCIKVLNMEEAVKKAYEITGVGKACLLSPAASSYNQYKNFEERGEHFIQCIKSGIIHEE